MTSSNTPNLDALLDTAKTNELISPQTLNIMAGDIGSVIQAGLGILPDDVQSAEPYLITLIIDDSTSIAGIPGGPEAVCTGQNLYIDAFINSKQTDGIVVSTWLLNKDDPLQPFVLIKDAIRLQNRANYKADGFTPLYRKACSAIGSMLVELKVRYLDAGCAARGIVLVVTDGRNEDYTMGRTIYTADMVKTMIADLGENCIVQFMGIEGNQNVDFRQIAKEMGIVDGQIMTTKNSPHEIRESFGMASKSALSASKSATGFSATQAKGFTV